MGDSRFNLSFSKSWSNKGDESLINNDNDKNNVNDNNEIPRSMLLRVFLITCQSFLLGYNLASLNACLVKCTDLNDDGFCTKYPGTIYNYINLSDTDVQLATSLLVIGAWIGCLIGAKPAESIGRRKTLLFNCLFFIIGGIIEGISNKYCLYIGKFLTGMGTGICSVLCPLLLSEIASSDTRGFITTLHQLNVTIAIFAADIMGFIFVNNVKHGWQYVQVFTIIPALIQVIFALYIPESPKWLCRQGKRDEAITTLRLLRQSGYNVEEEVENITQELRSDLEVATWTDVFEAKKAVIIGCGLMFFQAITGINSVILYSTTIFKIAGFESSLLATSLVGLTNVICTMISCKLVDIMGRKVLLLCGVSFMLIALTILSITLLAANNNPSAQGIVAVIMVLIFIAGFASGLGAVCWVILSEIMSTKLRSKAMALFLSVNWGFNLIISFFTLTLINSFGHVDKNADDIIFEAEQKNGVGRLYIVFAGFTLLCLLFVQFYVPETKGSTADLQLTKPLLSINDNEDENNGKDGNDIKL